jgi:hypothetical protein
MTKNNYIIASLAMDLKRAALGYYHGSEKTALRFIEEALKRKNEIKESEVKPYLRIFLNKISGFQSEKDKSRVAEDALMLSTIFQNYTLHFA